MDRRISIALIPVSGCSVDEAGGFRADSSVVKLRLEGVGGQELLTWRHAKLHLDFNVLNALRHPSLRAELIWQNVLVTTIQLNPFGRNRLYVSLYDFKLPSILEIKFSGDIGSHLDQEALIINFTSVAAEQASDLLGTRRHLISSASALTADLGLTQDSLDDKRAQYLEIKIAKALQESCGFSAIRLGDGEGRVLAYPDHFSDQEVLEQVLHYQFGPELMREARARYADDWIARSMSILKSLLVDSVKQADVVGLPVLEYFKDDMSDKMGQIAYACALTYGVSLTVGLDKSSYFGTNVFQSAAIHGRIFRSITTLAKQVTLVGPWDLRAPLGKAFNRGDLKHIKVSGHYSWRGHNGLGQYPDLFKKIEEEILNLGDLSRHLFLVGAGIFGKHYCNLIKNRNGVALDIGSVFNSWAKQGRPEAANDERISISQI